MRRILPLLLIIALLAGCTPVAEVSVAPTQEPTVAATQTPSPEPSQTPARMSAEELEAKRLEVLSENADFLGGLSQEQMLEDFEYFWDSLHTSYPFFGVARRAGIQADDIYAQYKAFLPQVQSDLLFVNLMAEMAAQFQGIGHLGVIMDSASYQWMCQVYETLKDDVRTAYLLDTLTGDAPTDSYAALGKVEAAVMALLEEGTGQEAAQEPRRAPVCAILEEGKIAHVSVPTFDGMQQEADAQVLMAFYEEIKDYEHLIIDITANSGGSDYYWMHNIAAPLIAQPMRWDATMIFAQSAYNAPYLRYVDGNDARKPTAQLPKLPALVQEDIDSMDSFISTTSEVLPLGEGERFSGKIWVLVSEQVYSSCETFAMFCKSTGFATLVGTQTGGDGGGVDPLILALPQSGLVYRFSNFYTINADGSNSEETGTTPDVPIQGEESALDACLREIGA